MPIHNKGVTRLKNGIFVPTAPMQPETAILTLLVIQQEPFVPNAMVKSPYRLKSSMFNAHFQLSWASACSIAGRKSFPPSTPCVVDKLSSVPHPWHIPSGDLLDEMISR